MLLLCLWCVHVSLAQNNPSRLSNLRSKYITTTNTRVKLDSLSIFPNTVSIVNVTADQYSVDPVNAIITWIKRPMSDSVKISYRVFPYQLNDTLFPGQQMLIADL